MSQAGKVQEWAVRVRSGFTHMSVMWWDEWKSGPIEQSSYVMSLDLVLQDNQISYVEAQGSQTECSKKEEIAPDGSLESGSRN